MYCGGKNESSTQDIASNGVHVLAIRNATNYEEKLKNTHATERLLVPANEETDNCRGAGILNLLLHLFALLLVIFVASRRLPASASAGTKRRDSDRAALVPPIISVCLIVSAMALLSGTASAALSVGGSTSPDQARRLNPVTVSTFSALRAAINSAPSDGTQTIIEVAGNLTWTDGMDDSYSIAVVNSGQNVLIRGTDQQPRITLDAQGSSSSKRRFFEIKSGATLELSLLKLRKGYLASGSQIFGPISCHTCRACCCLVCTAVARCCCCFCGRWSLSLTGAACFGCEVTDTVVVVARLCLRLNHDVCVACWHMMR